MSENFKQRRLTTILAADVFGYSRLMAQNEEYTLRTLKAYRDVIDRLINRHEGRIFNTAGDSVLAEFQSAVEAVRCAIAIQEELRVRNAEVDEPRRMEFRIGVNVGDVLVDGDNLYGDGVNIAARLEGIAAPGGICISGSVFTMVRNKLSCGFKDMGPQSVKNIPEPVPAYRLIQTVTAPVGKSRKPLIAAGIAAILVLLIAGVAGLRLSASSAERAWAAVQNTTDQVALEDFIRRFGDTSYANLARERLAALPANTLTANDAMERAWAAVENTTDRAALEDFVQRYGNSKYANSARARLAALPANTLTANDAVERAWAAVENTTDRAALEDFVQRYGNSKYANPARARLAALPANARPSDDPVERAWAAVQNTTDRAALEDFVKRHGNSKYGDRARARLAALPANTGPPKDPAERAWAAVQNTTDRTALEDFIRRYGNSIYGILARARLAELTAGPPEQSIGLVRECDRLAANPDDTARRNGVAGTRWELLDPMEAGSACRAATAAQPDDPRLMYQMGRVLDKQGASSEALSWYRRATDKGYLEAMNNLGIMFTNGRGVERNDTEALHLFRKAADGGSADAITNLGFMYHYGRGVAPNLEESVRLFHKAADAGSVEGMYWLGLSYEIGAGVKKDDAEALKWYRKAADRGSASAMNKLGVMYSSGTGIDKDMTEAVRWYRAAAAAGSTEAKANLSRLGN